MKLNDTCIKPRLIISIKSQMPLKAPISKLIDYRIVKLIVHPHVGTLLSVLICRTEFTRTVASVDRLEIHDKRIRCLLTAKKIVDITSLKFSSRHKLQLQIARARKFRKIFSGVPTETPHKIIDSDRHVVILLLFI